MGEKKPSCLAVLFAFVLLSGTALFAAPPNIVIILADDLGYGDLGSYGARWIRTPQLDRMARQGVRFTNFYAPAPVCSPSRAALLTGRYPIRTGITRVLKPSSEFGLPAEEVTLAELLRQHGYRTGIIGKWHLGDRAPFLPLQHGFDEFFGMPYSNDMKPLRFLEGNRILQRETPADPLLTRRYTERAVDFIRRHAGVPFFLYLPHSMPHYPIDATAAWKGTSRDGIYGDVVQELDWSVGKVLDALRESGVERETAVFFTSDNGSWRQSSSHGLRGKKGSTWEGGMRVPLLVRFPGIFPEGRIADAPVMGFDLFTTVLELAGIDPPVDRIVDGLSLAPLLTDAMARPSDTDFSNRPLFFYRDESVLAVRLGKWKLHVARHSRWSGLRKIEPELFDLDTDPSESTDLAPEHPEIVQQLQRAIENHRSRTED